ncbi:MAG: putative lipid II flippase FtsW [Eubacterium sp.]|nr:putative lipid II flippase FtsW [Eubacterium sp.]
MAGTPQRGQTENARFFDYSLLFILIFLLGFGLVMLYSVSSYEAVSSGLAPTYYLRKQFIAIVIGLVVMFIVAMIPYDVWKSFSLPAYVLAIILCAAVLVMGTDANGSTRWLTIGGISVQPSELAKVAIIIFLAAILSRIPREIASGYTVIKIVLFLLPILAMVAYSNLSTAIIIAGIAIIMMFVVSPKYSHFIALIGVGILGAIIMTLAMSYRSARIKAWIHPERYPDDAYQTLQGLYAIGSGGLFGKGLGGSIQKLDYVPEAQNDFIFSIIVEELGIFGAVCVIVLFALLIWRFMVIANNAKDLFGSLIVVGVMAHISLQVILNIAVVTNTIPNTGITLPFISYGGTSVVVLLAEMGLVLAVSRSIPLKMDSLGTLRMVE